MAPLFPHQPLVTQPSSLESRLIEIETQLMHLQHDYDQLNAEFLRQRNLIVQQQRQLESLEKHLRERADRPEASSGDADP